MVGDSVAGGLAGFAHGRRVRSVGDPERAAPVSAQEVLDPFHGHVVRENGPKEGQILLVHDVVPIEHRPGAVPART